MARIVNKSVADRARQQKQAPVKLRDVNPPRNFILQNDFDELLSLALNMFKIECTDNSVEFGYLQENFIIEQLVRTNVVGYDRMLNQWAIAYGYGLNNYWRPTDITYVLPGSRQSFTRKASYEPNENGAYMLRGLRANISFADIIRKTTDFMSVCDSVIWQNIEAVRTPFICVVDNPDMRLSVLQAIQERQQGEPVIVAAQGTLREALQGVQTYTEYVADRIEELRDKRLDRLLNKLGTMTANIYKRERVQSSEVNATVGQCEDYAYMLIDNFNKQCKTYGLPFKMSLNTALEELYDGEGAQMSEPKEQIENVES